MIGNAPISELTGLPGWETRAEEKALITYARAVPENGVIVELGCEFGMSTGAFCSATNDTVSITSVDLFPGGMIDVHRKNLKEAGYEGRSQRIAGDSATVGLTWDTLIDLLFIDADHTYEGVLADMNAWLHHVRVGGVVIFHDCAVETNLTPHYLHHEVWRAVRHWMSEHVNEFEALPTVDTMAIFRRVAHQLASKEAPEISENDALYDRLQENLKQQTKVPSRKGRTTKK